MKRTLILLALLLGLSTWNIDAKTLGTDMATVTTSGTIRGNAKQVILIFSSDFTGTVAGASADWAAGGSINLTALQTGDVIGSIDYTVTAGNIKIIRLQ